MAKNARRIVANKQNGISFQTVSLVTTKGKIIEDIPRITKILIILLPRTLPRAIWVFPWMLAKIFTISSGAEVPKATTVNPIIKSETLSFFAIAEAPSTRKSAPLIRKINPIINSMYTNTL